MITNVDDDKLQVLSTDEEQYIIMCPLLSKMDLPFHQLVQSGNHYIISTLLL